MVNGAGRRVVGAIRRIPCTVCRAMSATARRLRTLRDGTAPFGPSPRGAPPTPAPHRKAPSMSVYDTTPYDTTLPSRRARRAADAALRADVRRRDRIDRHARTVSTSTPSGGLVGRLFAAVIRHAHV